VLSRRLPTFAAALWWGSLTAVGFLVVPMLFANLPSPAMAGNMAAKLFAAQTWVSTVCALLLLLLSRSKKTGALVDWAPTALMFIAGGLLLALLNEFAVSPRIVARENLKLWHAVGSSMYLLQWLCAGVTLWKLTLKA
jgi:undecaprenyl pyrophosphate phosphatase UppP